MMYKFGLIGYPLSHSHSPDLHMSAMKAMGIEGRYDLYPISPTSEGENIFQEILKNLRMNNLNGVNVTIPHKLMVLPFMDVLTPTAQAIGAVNTIIPKQGKLIGDNTDAPGFLIDLKGLMEKSLRAPYDKTALILGAGGSARAVVYALAQDGWKTIVAARRLTQAEQLITDLSPYLPPHLLKSVLLESKSLRYIQTSLVVNTTPVGMYPNIDASPWPDQLAIPKAMFYDLVYNPPETVFIKEARKNKCIAASGIGMLVEQAALALEKWTGLSVPRDPMYKVII